MKIIIADDHALVRNALTFMLNAQPDMEVVGDAADGNEVFMKLENTQADLVLMDISMPPGENGLQTTRRIKETHPEIKVIVLTMHDEESYVREALNAGADGFILKSTTDDILLDGIRQVHANQRYYSGYTSDRLDEMDTFEGDSLYASLSKREKEVLPLVALGYNNRDIADKLFISVKTVEVHKANIRKKLQVDSYADLLRYSVKNHLVDF
ncbi:MAG: two-component system, NarL family, response regulator NreC [Trichococcus sp.]|nr:two-component system, NarL family, response regulator NreC [Trichococcus sp.]